MDANPDGAGSSGSAEIVTEPASVETFQSFLRIITDTDIAEADVVATAWNPIIAQWAQGWTAPLLKPLLDSNINLQAFLAQLLRRIWVTMLDESPRVVGTYVYPGLRVRGRQKPSAPDGLAGDLHELLDCAHPGIRESDSFKDPWGDHFHPPAGKSWAPTSAHVPTISLLSSILPTTLQDSSVLRNIVATATSAGEDLNVVIMRAIPHFPKGLTGIGQSAETRAFLACHLISLYSPTPSTMKFAVSPQASRAMAVMGQLPEEDKAVLYAIVGPVTISLLSQPGDPPQITSWHSNPTLPLWYFLIDFTNRTSQYGPIDSRDQFKSALDRLHDSEVKNSFPALQVTGSTESTVPRLSLATVVAWLAETVLIINSKRGVARATSQTNVPVPDLKPKSRELAWMDSTTISDVDACLESLRSFGLDELWQNLSPSFREATTQAIAKASPQKYLSHLDTVCKENLEAYLSPNTPEETKNRNTVLWAKFVALDGQYAEAFRNVVLNLDKPSSKVVFNGLIRFFNPFPTDEEVKELVQLQQVYDKTAYEGPDDMPAHLADRFIQILTPLVRYHTVLAETLTECGVLTIMNAIRDERYNYPQTDSPLPEATRKAMRQKICDDMQSALSERMYISAQAKLLRENPGEMYTHQPSQTRRPIRRRPSWMATGG